MGRGPKADNTSKYWTRIVTITYFEGRKIVKKYELVDYFQRKVWGKNNKDALKIALLYFIMSFIYSRESTSSIPRIHFDLVENGRLLSMPLAMQVWMYDCCSVINPNIAVKVGDSILRILNWRVVIDQIHYAIMMEAIFSKNNNP
ncbi:hypothetical protein HAX54_041409, partial [Datura stramonium]|nr:hypothetical protein [Datura stramonium]